MGSISRSLNSILRSAQSEGYVDKDVAPTMRDGRLVIPVAPGLKRKIKGIVHDESASGKTVFIEPAEVVEANKPRPRTRRRRKTGNYPYPDGILQCVAPVYSGDTPVV